MQISTTVIPGLSFDLVIEEINHRDFEGHYLCYLASIYCQNRGTAVRRLVRRSRLPGAADVMRREIERNGIQSFRRFNQP